MHRASTQHHRSDFASVHGEDLMLTFSIDMQSIMTRYLSLKRVVRLSMKNLWHSSIAKIQSSALYVEKQGSTARTLSAFEPTRSSLETKPTHNIIINNRLSKSFILTRSPCSNPKCKLYHTENLSCNWVVLVNIWFNSFLENQHRKQNIIIIVQSWNHAVAANISLGRWTTEPGNRQLLLGLRTSQMERKIQRSNERGKREGLDDQK